MFKFVDTIPEQSKIEKLRNEIYSKNGKGFYIFKNYISQELVRDLQSFWTKKETANNFEMINDLKNKHFINCPNYLRVDKNNNKMFYNFFWNKPVNDKTFEIMYSAQILRNKVESRFSHSELFHVPGRCAEFRAQISLNGSHKDKSNISFINLHKDWLGPGEEFIDLSRIQVTLFLSDFFDDYSGEGFNFTTNQGEKLNFGRDSGVKSGDLVFWKYTNTHGVLDVKTQKGQIGFLRITMPNTIFNLPSNKNLNIKSKRNFFKKLFIK